METPLTSVHHYFRLLDRSAEIAADVKALSLSDLRGLLAAWQEEQESVPARWPNVAPLVEKILAHEEWGSAEWAATSADALPDAEEAFLALCRLRELTRHVKARGFEPSMVGGVRVTPVVGGMRTIRIVPETKPVLAPPGEPVVIYKEPAGHPGNAPQPPGKTFPVATIPPTKRKK